jgi:serine-type anaerobic sulfatase-maturating enzyme
VNSAAQRKFGEDKHNMLPRYCRERGFLFECRGECPRNRFVTTPDGEAGLNYLCAGLKDCFGHVERYMRIMGGLLGQRRPVAEIMALLRTEDAESAGIRRCGPQRPAPL